MLAADAFAGRDVPLPALRTLAAAVGARQRRLWA
jgi:hypothetical protein